MAQKELEQRVAELEQQVAELQQRLGSAPAGNWQQAIGMFTDRPEMLEIFADAVKLREEDRKRTRPRKKVQRRSAS